MKKEDRSLAREKRKKRIRSKVSGDGERPRLSVYRSLKHIHAQVIDDTKGITLVSASSFEKGQHTGSKLEDCKKIGTKVAERCLEKGIKKIIFDKNGFVYHGRVKALADGAREGGLAF